jgi:hypothetical protein
LESRDILRGRQEIAAFLGVSLDTLERITALRLIPVCRLTQKSKSMVIVTKRKLLDAIDAETDRQSRDIPGRVRHVEPA